MATKAADGLPNYLDVVHHSRLLAGLHRFVEHHQDELPHISNIYRLHHRQRDVLTIFPTIDLAALGLVHIHFFVTSPSPEWEKLSCGVDALWLSSIAGEPVLYLHALAPREHVDDVTSCVARYGRARWVVTADSWQLFNTRFVGASTLRDETPAPARRRPNILRSCPLIVPVAMELYERRLSLKNIWQVITKRLGTHVWEYLPRVRRRFGIRYVAESLSSAEELFRQNIIRYTPLLKKRVEVFLHTTLDEEHVRALCNDLRTSCPTIDVAFGEGDTCFLRITGDTQLLNTLITLHLPGEAFLRDTTRSTAMPRFAYEQLFDPKNCSWQFNPDHLEVSDEGRTTSDTTTTTTPTHHARNRPPPRADRETHPHDQRITTVNP